MLVKSRIGETVGPYTEEITDQRVLAFARSIGARSDRELPPTFLTVLRQGELELFQRLGISLSSILHGEQEYEYHAPLRVGDRVSYTAKLAQAFEKRGRARAGAAAGPAGPALPAPSVMTFLVFETQVKVVGRDEVAATARTTVIVRGDAGAKK